MTTDSSRPSDSTPAAAQPRETFGSVKKRVKGKRATQRGGSARRDFYEHDADVQQLVGLQEKSRLHRAFQLLIRLAAVARAMAAPLVVSLIAAVVLLAIPQTREVYFILADHVVGDSPDGVAWSVVRALLAMLLVGAFAVLLVYLCDITAVWNLRAEVSRTAQGMKPELAAVSESQSEARLVRALVGALPLWAFGFGLLITAWFAFSGVDRSASWAALLVAGLAIIATGITLSIYAFWTEKVAGLARSLSFGLLPAIARDPVDPAHLPTDEYLAREGRGRLFLVWILTLAATTVVVAAFPLKLPPLIGLVAVAAVFFMLLAMGLAVLSSYPFPVVSVLVSLAVIWGVLGWTNNHDLRVAKHNAPDLLSFEDAFTKWLRGRADLDQFDRYPVFLVAASGGGIYASAQAAAVLARLQDACPHFAQHVFAISGVSGGSLGAAVFSGLADRQARAVRAGECPLAGDAFLEGTKRVLSADYLSPTIAAGLFPDLTRYFVPGLGTLFTDRAHAFETALEAAARPLCADDQAARCYMTASYFNHWSRSDRPVDSIRQAAPALVINSTWVETGQRLYFAPFDIGAASIRPYTYVATGGVRLRPTLANDLSMSTAVYASARFPWIAPSGWLPIKGGKARFVDGGYWENSAAETVEFMATAIKGMSARLQQEGREIDLRFILIGAAAEPREGFWSRLFLDETVVPLTALMNTRTARAGAALARLAPFARPQPDDLVHPFVLDLTSGKFPLGWQVSRRTLDRIADQFQLPGAADTPCAKRETSMDMPTKIFHDNSCELAHVIQALAPTRP